MLQCVTRSTSLPANILLEFWKEITWMPLLCNLVTMEWAIYIQYISQVSYFFSFWFLFVRTQNLPKVKIEYVFTEYEWLWKKQKAQNIKFKKKTSRIIYATQLKPSFRQCVKLHYYTLNTVYCSTVNTKHCDIVAIAEDVRTYVIVEFAFCVNYNFALQFVG